MEIVALDSSENVKNKSKQLLCRILAIAKGRVAEMIEKQSIKQDKKGRWCTFNLEDNNRKIRIIKLY